MPACAGVLRLLRRDRRLDVGAGTTIVSTASAPASQAAAARRRPPGGACPPRRAAAARTRASARPARRARSCRLALDHLEQHRRDVVVAAAAVRRLDERARGRVEIVAVRAQDLLDRRRRRPCREAVGAEQVDVARLRPSTENASTSTSGSVPSARVITERCGCTSASRGRQLAAPHELGDERVVVGQLLEPVVAQQVRARVADVAERRRGRRARRARRSSSSPCPHVDGVGRRALVHAPVRLLDQLA